MNNGNSNNWLNIHCTGVISNTSAIGAKVWVRAMINGIETWQVREISGQTGVLGQSSLHAHFGFGAGGTPDSLRIEWPSGIVQGFSNVPVNMHLDIVEDISLNANHSAVVTLPELKIFPNPVTAEATVEFELNQSAEVDLQILNASGRMIQSFGSANYPAGKNTIQINMENIPAGIYFCRLQIDQRLSFMKRIVVQ